MFLDVRQHVCAMAKILDEGVGNITAALKSKGIYDQTIQIFSSKIYMIII